MTITFVCRSSKVSKKDGLTPLELYVIIDGKRRFVSLKRRIDHKLFNAKKQIVRGDTQTNEYIKAMHENDRKVYSAELSENARSLSEIRLSAWDAVIIGNEGHGVPEDISRASDGGVYIPISAKTS